MSRNRKVTLEDYGEPDLKIAGFQLWIHGGERPESEEDDEGWLSVTAHCGQSGASVWIYGESLMVADIAAFGDQCAAMLGQGAQSAKLEPYDPDLRISLDAADSLGHIRARVKITPNYMLQRHRIDFEIDQSYLPPIIRQCAEIVRKRTVRGCSETENA